MSDVSNEKQWYVVNTYVGHENRVKDNLEKRLETMGISDNLFRIVVAEETAIDIKNEKAKEVVRNIFPRCMRTLQALQDLSDLLVVVLSQFQLRVLKLKQSLEELVNQTRLLKLTSRLAMLLRFYLALSQVWKVQLSQ